MWSCDSEKWAQVIRHRMSPISIVAELFSELLDIRGVRHSQWIHKCITKITSFIHSRVVPNMPSAEHKHVNENVCTARLDFFNYCMTNVVWLPNDSNDPAQQTVCLVYFDLFFRIISNRYQCSPIHTMTLLQLIPFSESKQTTHDPYSRFLNKWPKPVILIA